jgi:hypothetical protein
MEIGQFMYGDFKQGDFVYVLYENDHEILFKKLEDPVKTAIGTVHYMGWCQKTYVEVYMVESDLIAGISVQENGTIYINMKYLRKCRVKCYTVNYEEIK